MSKTLTILLFFVLSSSYSLSQSANNALLGFNTDESTTKKDYYYYKGKKIPLTLNDDKVCVSIPKDNKISSDIFLANVKVQETIQDERFDIFVILKSDFENISSADFWKEHAKSVILSSCYITEEGFEVFTSPYLNIRLKDEQDKGLLTAYAQKYGLKIIKQDSFMPLWFILAVTQHCKKNILECANELWETGDFRASVPDFCSDIIKFSNDPLYNQQWGLHNTIVPDMDISASAAWNYATGKNIKIAILDSGVDLNHIDLSSNISNLSYDTETESSPSVVYCDHGTHCAGIAAAIKDNSIHIAGVAPEAAIVPISKKLKVTTSSPMKFADGITWAYEHGVDIISNSWGYPTHHSIIDEAINNAFRYGRQGKGCVIVFATGNEWIRHIAYPANCNDTILAVGAIDIDGFRAFFSNFGTGLDIVAPGCEIISTIPNDSVESYNGTSMACPHVAGVAALILERNPELTVNQVNSIINRNAKKLSIYDFDIVNTDGLWNEEIGYGLVDAYSSVINTPHAVYIQNDTITGTRTISADSIYVGRNVASTKPYGDVILGQGDITLKADYIEIRNSTTVPLGTTLLIDN